MVRLTHGNLLDAPAEALVNTVNTVGVMGKGIALQFKQAYPENFEAYKRACDQGELEPGRVLVFDRGSLGLGNVQPRYIVNVPTKRHWRGKSKLEYISAGLEALREEVIRLGIRSIAIPPLGCGNGGLDWNEVRPLIEGAFADLSEVDVLLYAPGHAPKAEALPVRTKRPKMTRALALMVRLMDAYRTQDYKLGLLEAQKLAYLLQASGVPLRLAYVEGHYGPYADNLNHVLQRMEGHYIRGYGDRSNIKAAITLAPGALEAANERLASDEEAAQLEAHLVEVRTLIEGFETPYGLELLATIHWLLCRHPELTDVDSVSEAIRSWNSRKAKLMQPVHVEIALDHLRRLGWTQDLTPA